MYFKSLINYDLQYESGIKILPLQRMQNSGTILQPLSSYCYF